MGILHEIMADVKRWGYIFEVPESPEIKVPQVPPRWIHEDVQEVILKRLKERWTQKLGKCFCQFLGKILENIKIGYSFAMENLTVLIGLM